LISLCQSPNPEITKKTLSTILLQSIDSVAAAVERDFKPAIENPENTKSWKKSLFSALKGAKLNARKSMQLVGANFKEATADLKASSNAANEKLVKEAELGARNCGKNSSAITSTINGTSTSDKPIVAKLTEIEDKGTEISKNVSKGIKDTTVNKKKSLQTGWLTKKIGDGDIVGSNDASSTGTAVTVKDTSSENISLADAIDANAQLIKETTTAAAAPAPVKEYETNQTRSSTIMKEEEKEAFPPSTIVHAATVTAAATEIKKNLQDSSLDAVTQGGRHISMLSAPMKTKTTTKNANTDVALSFSKSNGSSNSPGASSGGSGASKRAALDALKAAAGAGVSPSVPAAVSGNGGSDGGSAGGSGRGGGNGSNGGDGSSDDSSSNNDGNKNDVYLLLLALTLTGVGYYISQQQAKKEPTVENS